MMCLRFQRPASAPAGNPATSCAAATVASTNPESAAEPLIASTSNGKAIAAALKPKSDENMLPHSNAKLRFRDNGVRSACVDVMPSPDKLPHSPPELSSNPPPPLLLR